MSQWVSVKDKMPEDGVDVLCTDEDVKKMMPAPDEIYTAAWDDNQKFWTTEWWGDHDWMCKVNPLYWAPLPSCSEGLKMNKTKEREEFEKWAEEETGFDLYRTDYAFTAPEDQQYMDHDTNGAWFAWLARAELETKK